jgi:hypothetical protein
MRVCGDDFKILRGDLAAAAVVETWFSAQQRGGNGRTNERVNLYVRKKANEW